MGRGKSEEDEKGRRMNELRREEKIGRVKRRREREGGGK